VLDTLESRDLSTDVLLMVVGGTTCTGAACTTTGADAAGT
jgi:hypothetical protein